jgi:hypothetical protein
MDANRKPVSVVLASAYAPIGAAKELIRQDFAPQLERCFSAPKFDQVLLMGINHFLISCRNLSRVSNVGLSKLTVESDHEPLHINLPIARNLSKQHESKANFINRGMLRDLAVARNFCHAIWKHLGNDPLCPELLKYPALRNGCMSPQKKYFLSVKGNTLVGSRRDNNLSLRPLQSVTKLSRRSTGNANQESLSRILSARSCSVLGNN